MDNKFRNHPSLMLEQLGVFGVIIITFLISSLDDLDEILGDIKNSDSTTPVSYTHLIIDEEDAKECVNDVWLKVWNSIPPGKPKHLAGYLAKIARNLALDKYRQHNAAKRGGGHLEASLEELEECISGSN